MMTRKWKLAVLLLAGACLMLPGCAESDKEQTAAMQQTEVEQESGDTAAETENIEAAEKEEGKKEEQQAVTETDEERKQIDTSLYKYILCKEDNSTGVKPMVGINIPKEYVITDYFSNKAGGKDNYAYRHVFEIQNIVGEHTEQYGNTLEIWQGYTVENGRLIKKGVSDELLVEEQGETDTLLGTAKLYFCKEEVEDSYTSYIDCKEIALIPVDDTTIYVEFSYIAADGIELSYLGEIEKILPGLFKPEEQTSQTEEVSVKHNYEIVDKSKWDYVFGRSDSNSDTLCLGIRDNLTDLGVESFAANRYSGDACMTGSFRASDFSKEVYISTADADYETYFGTGDVYFNHFGSVMEKQQVGEAETPFGQALLYYVKSKTNGEDVWEQEVALLNNQGANIVIVYCDTTQSYDGVYDGNIEKALTELFREE